MRSPRRVFIIAIGTTSLALASLAAPAADTPQSTEPGVWQKHEYSFVFMGFTTTYSCDGLADKLKVLLKAAGARADAKVRSGACASGFGRPDRFARADMSFYTLAPASAATAADSKPVDGTWLPVALTPMRPRELARGDCELIEQFKTNVLPLFTTRNLENRVTCIPHQDSGSVIDLKFESFGVPGIPKRPAAPVAANTAAASAEIAVP